jgi:YHS domain-containing protein
MNQQFKSSLYLLMIGSMLTNVAFAADWNTNKDNVVLDGHDVVAYHALDKSIKGSAMFQTEYDGARFFFSNAGNQAAFSKEPQKYVPKYNGYCAFAVSAKNAKVPANADTFKIYNGELLVFFNDDYEGQKFNTKIPWNADEKSMYSTAQKNWMNLSK